MTMMMMIMMNTNLDELTVAVPDAQPAHDNGDILQVGISLIFGAV